MHELGRWAAACGDGPLRKGFGEPQVKELHRGPGGGIENSRVGGEIGFDGEHRAAHHFPRICGVLTGEFGGDAPTQPTQAQRAGAADLAKQWVRKPHHARPRARVDAHQPE